MWCRAASWKSNEFHLSGVCIQRMRKDCLSKLRLYERRWIMLLIALSSTRTQHLLTKTELIHVINGVQIGLMKQNYGYWGHVKHKRMWRSNFQDCYIKWIIRRQGATCCLKWYWDDDLDCIKWHEFNSGVWLFHLLWILLIYDYVFISHYTISKSIWLNLRSIYSMNIDS